MDFNNYNDFSKPNRFSGIDRNSKRVLSQTTEEKKKIDEKIDEKVTDVVENSVKNEIKDEDESKKRRVINIIISIQITTCPKLPLYSFIFVISINIFVIFSIRSIAVISR